MTPQEIQKLLGGYATGTLTDAEREALFAAALQDQALFDALAKEQPLHDLLRDPAARAHLLASIDEPKRAWWRRSQWVLVGSLAAACLVIAAGIYLRPKPPAARPTLVAKLDVPPPPASLTAQAPQAEPLPPPPPAPRKRIAAAAGRRAAVPERAEVRQLDKVLPLSAPPPSLPAATPAPPTELKQATQNVEVTAATPAVPKFDQNAVAVSGAVGGVLPPQNARALFYDAPGLAHSQFLPQQSAAGTQLSAQFGVRTDKAAMWVRNLGVKWTALRKQPDGLFSEVDPEQIQAGDIVKLRLVPNDDGFLSVNEGARVFMPQRPVRRLDPLDTPEITGPVGRKELTIVLSRQQQAGLAGGGGGAGQTERARQAKPASLVRAAAAADQLSEADRNEHAVYEVKTGNNPLAPVLVRVPLHFK